MSTLEKIRMKQALCEIIFDVLDGGAISWRKRDVLNTSYRDEETGEWKERPKTEEEISDNDRAILAAIDQIEQALLKLI